MMAKISSLNGLISALSASEGVMMAEMKKAVTKSAVKVQATVKSKFGDYQGAVGPYPAWEPLKEETVKRKLKAGAPGDDPLIGHYEGKSKNHVYPTSLRNSILVEVNGLTGQVGTNDPIGKYHEYGTSRIPPRPFLRTALYQNEDFIKDQFREAVKKALANALRIGG